MDNAKWIAWHHYPFCIRGRPRGPLFIRQRGIFITDSGVDPILTTTKFAEY